MIADDNTDRLVTKQDMIHIVFILTVALAIGIYLILTTVLISKDGVFYIEQAKKFQSDPIGVIKVHSFGYPFLIFVSHKLASLFSDNQSIYVWIYSAQAANLFCRLLALIMLYFIGKLLVGSKTSLLAVLILVILPYPAQYGSDVLRDWPHILFLVSGLLLLLMGARQCKWWMFGAAGLIAGLGFMIRLECVQLVIYGILWLLVGLFSPHNKISKTRLLGALFFLLIGFLIPAASYITVRGSIPYSALQEQVVSSDSWGQDGYGGLKLKSNDNIYAASSLPGSVVRAIGKVFWDISENLMYFFLPIWVIGIYYRFRRQGVATEVEKFFIPVFVVFNLIILILVFSYKEYLSRRYSIPLIALTIFYMPIGLWAFSNWLGRRFFKDWLEDTRRHHILLLALLSIGIFKCVIGFIATARTEKLNYRSAAQWLEMNTGVDDIIGVQDKRITFYAGRKELLYEQRVPERTRYVVAILKDGQVSEIEDEFSDAKKGFFASGDNKQTGISIYDMRKCVSDKVSFDGYRWEKVDEEKYRFTFTFRTKIGFEKDWAIYFHGQVKDENIMLLPIERRQSGFANWDFYPEPVTSSWPKEEYVTITREISAKPIPYNFELGFYTGKEGLHGRRLNFGWIDLGGAEQGSGK